MGGLDVLIESTKGRSAFYGYLSQVFMCPPDEKFVGQSAKLCPHFAAFAKETENGSILEGTEDLEKYIYIEENSDRLMIFDMLNTIYTSTFLLGVNSVPVCESVFLSPDHLIKQEPWEKVFAFYNIRSFKKPKDCRECEDHIAVELLFMQQMCELIVRLYNAGKLNNIEAALKEQFEFINEHLIKWIFKFADLTIAKEKNADIPLYLASAKILKGFVFEDSKLLGSIFTL